jgi:hypothetical protein
MAGQWGYASGRVLGMLFAYSASMVVPDYDELNARDLFKRRMAAVASGDSDTSKIASWCKMLGTRLSPMS